MYDILNFLMVIISLLIAFFSLRLIYIFKGGVFERPWKPLFLIPFFMTGVVILETFEINILRLRSLMFLLSLISVLISLHQFYIALQKFNG
jgi:hypothetical protein